MDAFTQAYINTALEISTDENDVPLDQRYQLADIEPATLASMQLDCALFQKRVGEALDFVYIQYTYDAAQAGYDFWMTRNGHGVGFWDRYLDGFGDFFTKITESWPPVDLYVTDDGQIAA